jgi:ATP-dependent RNA helicase DDX52/ROK1
MSGSDFASLTIGAKFGASAADAKALFRKAPNPLTSSAASNAQQTVADKSTVHVPPPAGTLNLLGKAKAVQPQAAITEPEDSSDMAPLKQQSEGVVRKRLASMKIQSTACDFVILKHFTELLRPPHRVPKKVVDNLFQREHRSPTPIQTAAVPLLLQGRDVLACAPTGSGKTLAFLVPLLARLRVPDREAGVRGLVLSPTKELAVQLEREAFFLMKGERWKLVQHGQSTAGKDVMVTTPARAAALVAAGKLDLKNVEYIVFDEGDKLWDGGADLMKDIDGILAASTRAEKVVCLFSATLSERVERLARSVMRDPVRLIVKGRAEASADVDHKLLFVGSEYGKIVAMRNLIREGIKPPVLVFVQSVERTKELFDEIRGSGLRVAVLNAKMTAEERDDTVLQFRLGQIWVLISTELLARGVDFKGVGTVVNFDMPLTVESYVHRSGRTGRAGRRGASITFFTEADKERLPAIANVIRNAGAHVDDWIMEKLDKVTAKRQKQLERTVPQRAVVSTKKRMQIGEKRVNAALKAAERGEAGSKAKRNRGEADDGQFSDGSESIGDEPL